MNAMPRAWTSLYLFHAGIPYGAESDTVLVHHVGPAIERLRDSEGLQQWFFIRYREQRSHVRLRVRGCSRERLQSELQAAGSGIIESIDAVEYEPEFVRYGGPHAIVVAENLFERSSEIALRTLRERRDDVGARRGQALLALLATFTVFFDDDRELRRALLAYSEMYARALTGGTTDAFDEVSTARQEAAATDYVREAIEAIRSNSSLPPALESWRDALIEAKGHLRKLIASGSVWLHDVRITHEVLAWRFVVPSYAHMMSNRLGFSIPDEVFIARVAARCMISGLERNDAADER